MQEMKPIKEGKVREIYDNGDSLIMVATDRISCFDVILNNQVTKKGTVLTQMSKFWFDMTEDILPNHMISVDVKDMPEFFQQEKFDGWNTQDRGKPDHPDRGQQRPQSGGNAGYYRLHPVERQQAVG